MKKIFFFFLLTMLPVYVSAQFFQFKDGSFVDEQGKGYVVLDFANQTKIQLFNSFKSALTSIYVSAKDVISENEPDVITVSAVAKDVAHYNVMGIGHTVTMPYTIVFHFKDNKVRIDDPTIKFVDDGYGFMIQFKEGGNPDHFYKKNGEIRHKKFYNAVNPFFDNLINDILKKINIEEDW